MTVVDAIHDASGAGAPSPDLRFLMVAAAAGVDTALKQDDTGGFGFGGLDLFD